MFLTVDTPYFTEQFQRYLIHSSTSYYNKYNNYLLLLSPSSSSSSLC